jgi:type IV pilus assembly protein PilC
MKFTYQARTKDGKVVTGNVEASGQDAAMALLQKYDVFVTSLQEESQATSFFEKFKFQSRVTKKDLIIFSRQLAVMLESQVPVIQSLTSLALQSSKKSFQKIIKEISESVEEGAPLSESFARFPKIFDKFFVNLLKSGEASGKIPQSLYYISSHLESEQEIVSQVRQAMIYPIFTVSVLFIVGNIIVIFLLPKVQDLIQQSTTNPDAFTVATLAFYSFLEHWWWLMLFAFVGAVVGLIFYFRTSGGKKIFDKFILKAPFMGSVLKKVFLARFCGNIATLIISGISINRALEITAGTVNNDEYKRIVEDIGKNVSEGEKMSSILSQHSDYFPSFVVQMIKVGEETGKLDKTLVEVETFYQKEIKKAIDLFLALLEPMLILVLGLIVGALAISVFLPLYNTLGNI